MSEGVTLRCGLVSLKYVFFLLNLDFIFYVKAVRKNNFFGVLESKYFTDFIFSVIKIKETVIVI